MNYEAIQPLYPNLLVRLQPRERKVGLFFLPGDMNKPIHEGVVLKTWRPQERLSRVELTSDVRKRLEVAAAGDLCEDHDSQEVCYACFVIKTARDILGAETVKTVASQITPGDVILFSHYEGDSMGDEDKIVLVNEQRIHGTYQPDQHDIAVQMRAVIDATYTDDSEDSTTPVHDDVAALLRDFVIVPKTSFTSSGKSINGKY